MTAVSIRKDYRSRLDSPDVVSVNKVLKFHILERKYQISAEEPHKFAIFLDKELGGGRGSAAL